MFIGILKKKAAKQTGKDRYPPIPITIFGLEIIKSNIDTKKEKEIFIKDIKTLSKFLVKIVLELIIFTSKS